MRFLKVSGINEYKYFIDETIAIEVSLEKTKFFKHQWFFKDWMIVMTNRGQIFGLKEGDYLIKSSYVDKFMKMNRNEFFDKMKIREVIKVE